MGKSLLIVGGSLVGVRLALEESKKGNRVYLLEHAPSLPGDGSPYPELEEVRKDKNIQIIANANLEKVEEGNRIKVRIKQKTSRIAADKCDDCRDCIRVCPVNLAEDGAVLRTAVGFSFLNPGVYHILREEKPACQDTCPAQLDIRGYISLISEGKFAEAIALIREETPFVGVLGYICTHPCEGECNRGTADAPLAIRALKRFLADWERSRGEKPIVPARLPARKERVAVIGAGPAGLTCAYDLARKGYQVTIFEALPAAGGMLYVGIPEYRLPRQVLASEAEIIKGLGVDIRLNTPIGKELTLDNLFQQGFKAICVGVGAHLNQRLEIPGEESDGVIPGVCFLRDLNLKKEVKMGKRVAVVGGGNVAIDSARSAIRLGAREVTIIYRRTRDEMPASAEEIEGAEKEDIKIQYLAAPVKVLADNGKVKGATCIRMELGEADTSGRRKPVPIKGSEFDIEMDTLIPAIGQKVDTSFLGNGDGVGITKSGTIGVNAETLATGRAGVFAAGDAVTGPDVAISAISAAKKAAKSIDEYLKGS